MDFDALDVRVESIETALNNGVKNPVQFYETTTRFWEMCDWVKFRLAAVGHDYEKLPTSEERLTYRKLRIYELRLGELAEIIGPHAVTAIVQSAEGLYSPGEHTRRISNTRTKLPVGQNLEYASVVE